MEHKFLSKMAAITLGLAMAIGVGVGVANNGNSKAVYATAGDVFQLVRDASTLSSGNEIVIGNTTSGSSVYLLSTTQNSNNRAATGTFTVSNDKITLTDAAQVLTLGQENSHWTFNTGSGYLYAASSSSNWLRTQVTNNANGEWAISITNAGVATVTAQGSNTHNILKYNANNGNPIFSAYNTSGTVAIYRKIITPTGIALDETNLELGTGAITTLTATLSPTGATGSVVWSSSDNNVATVSNGVVTAQGAGSATITAFVDADSDGALDQGEINATCSVTVTAGTPATAIELNESSVNLLAGQQTTLSATVTPNNATDAVVWSTSDETTATVSDGVVTTLKNGIVTITATAGSVHADCELSITSATAAENFIGAKIDRTGKLIAKSGKNAIVDDGTGGFWAYANSNISQSAGAIVNLKGTSTVYSGGLEVASATVTTTENSITVSEATPLSESAAKDYLDAYLAEPSDPDFFMPTKKVSLRTGVIGGEGSYLTWEYGETLMETNYITGGMETGKIYDIEGYIFKFYTSGAQTYIVIAVTDASEVEIHATSIELDNDSLTIVEGDNDTLTATMSPAGSVDTIKWASSDEDVATVDGGVVTGVSVGSATVTAYIDADGDNVIDLGELKAECDVTVITPPTYIHTKVASYNFSSDNTSSTSEYNNATTLLARFNNNDDTSQGLSDIVTAVSSISKVYAGTANYYDFGIKFGTSSANGTFTLSLNTQVKRVVVRTIGWSSSDTLKVGDADAQTPGVAYNDSENDPIKTLKFDITQSNSVTFTYAKRGFIQSIDFYSGTETSDPQDFVDTASIVQTIHGRENYSAEVLTSVDNVAIRFGASISKYNWEDMKSKWGITDYGVMLMSEQHLTAGSYSSVEDALDKGASSTYLKDIHKCQNETPYADPYFDGDNYSFTVKVNFPDDDQYYDDVIYAAPYVIAGGERYFFGETNTSVQALALSLYNTGYSYLSDAALEMLVGD